MRIKADVIVSNRGLCEHNVKKVARAVTSSLSIGKKTICSSSSSSSSSAASSSSSSSSSRVRDDPEVFMMLCTAQNRSGTKYSCAADNVEKVFTKFLHEGKTTIRFKEPPHDLCITKCDVIELKAFLSVLRRVIECKDLSGLTLSAIAPASLNQVAKPKVKLCITQKKDYPITSGFPHTLEYLQAVGINLKRFDSRIVKLRHLSTLDLSDNAMDTLPDCVENMKSLTELHLAGNAMERVPGALWRVQNLRLLDLSRNRLRCIPNQISELKTLTTLKLDSNLLERLPFSLGKMSSLRHLSASGNAIRTLPGAMIKLTGLDSMDLSGNPLVESSNDDDAGRRLIVDNLVDIPPLLDLVVAACIDLGIRPKEEEVPATVRLYMDTFHRCPCGRVCLSSKAVLLVPMDFSRLARTFVCDGRLGAMLEASVCSRKCLEKFRSNPFAL